MRIVHWTKISILVVAWAEICNAGEKGTESKLCTAHKNIMYKIKLSGVENVASCT